MREIEQLADYRVTTTLSGVGLVASLPFVIYHILIHSWFIAVLAGGLNLVLATVCYVSYRYKGMSWANYVLGWVGNAAVIGVIWGLGPPSAYWIYPAFLVTVFVLPFGVATATNALALSCAVALVWWQGAPLDQVARIAATGFMVVCFGHVFARHVTRQRQALNSLLGQDPLSGAGNRRALDTALAEAVGLRARYGGPVSLVVIDIDHFKRVNDRYGHAAGDRIITRLVAIIRGRVRRVDRLFRYGGEEFVLLCQHTTRDQARALAESLRVAVMAETFAGVGGVTISAGVAELADGECPQVWFERADAALYAAKGGGRNNVQLAPQPPPA